VEALQKPESKGLLVLMALLILLPLLFAAWLAHNLPASDRLRETFKPLATDLSAGFDKITGRAKARQKTDAPEPTLTKEKTKPAENKPAEKTPARKSSSD